MKEAKVVVVVLIVLCVAVFFSIPVYSKTALPAGAPPEFRIAVISFLSGPGAGPFGVPARNAVEVVVDELNRGRAPAPYNTPGIGGVKIKLQSFDESGGAEKQVELFRGLAGKFDAIIAYISSADCLAVAPVAEELNQLLLLADCGTHRVFEEKVTNPKCVFRCKGHQVLDSVGAARYALAIKPDLKTIAGINQDYAWGRDNWEGFSRTMKQLKPDVKIVSVQWPKLFAGEYSAEISALLAAKPDVIYCSFWGGDMEAFIIQAAARGLFKRSLVIFNCGDTALPRLGEDFPEGVAVGARGPHGALAPDTELNRWFVKVYRDRYGIRPVYSSYHYVQALLGLKAAYEKAIAQKGRWPTSQEVRSALKGLKFETPSGTIRMGIGQGHQGIEPAVYGITGPKVVKGERELVNIIEFPAECVNPPPKMSTLEWIDAGLPVPKGVDCTGIRR